MAYPTIEENQAFCSIHGLCKISLKQSDIQHPITDKGLGRDEKVGKVSQEDISRSASGGKKSKCSLNTILNCYNRYEDDETRWAPVA